MRRQPRNFENSLLVAHRRVYFSRILRALFVHQTRRLCAHFGGHTVILLGIHSTLRSVLDLVLFRCLRYLFSSWYWYGKRSWMLVLMLHSAEHCNFVRMGEYYVSCSSDISRVRESFRMTVHHDVARNERSKIRASYVTMLLESLAETTVNHWVSSQGGWYCCSN